MMAATMGEKESGMVHYRIDAARSRFTVRAFASGLLSAFGHSPTIAIRRFTGDIQVVPGKLEAAAVHVSVSADSLEVADDISDKDRADIERVMKDEVLETAKYPEITFDSREVSGTKIFEGNYRVQIVAELSLHGVTRNCTMQAQATMGDDSLRANGDFSLRQTDFGIKLVSAAGGTIKVKDELKFSFDVVAYREIAGPA